MKLKIPFKIARRADALAAVSKSFWRLSKKRAESKSVRDAVQTFLKQAKQLKKKRHETKNR